MSDVPNVKPQELHQVRLEQRGLVDFHASFPETFKWRRTPSRKAITDCEYEHHYSTFRSTKGLRRIIAFRKDSLLAPMANGRPLSPLSHISAQMSHRIVVAGAVQPRGGANGERGTPGGSQIVPSVNFAKGSSAYPWPVVTFPYSP